MSAPAVLLIYGLGGSIHDFGLLPARLRQAGFETLTPLLAGHGTKPQDLTSVVMEQWLQDVRRAHQRLASQHETVHIVGMCMGSLLACELAKELSEAGRATSGQLVMLAPTLILDGWRVPWYQWLRHIHHVIPWLRRCYRVQESDPYGIKNERLRAIIKKRFAQGHGVHYAWVPMQSLWQLDRLRRRVMKGLGQLKQPTLMIHAREDEFSSVQTIELLRRNLGAQQIETLILENSYHMVCVDNDSPRLIEAVTRFLTQPSAYGETPMLCR